MTDDDGVSVGVQHGYVDVREIHPDYREFECVNCEGTYLEHESHEDDFYSHGMCRSCHAEVA